MEVKEEVVEEDSGVEVVVEEVVEAEVEVVDAEVEEEACVEELKLWLNHTNMTEFLSAEAKKIH